MKLLSQIMKLSSFTCEENHIFIEEDNPSDKFVTIEEELDMVEVGGIENLFVLPRLMLID